MKHDGLVILLANRFYRKNSLYSVEDLIQVGQLAIIQAEKSYDPAKGKESTYFWRCVRRKIFKFIKKHKPELSTEKFADDSYEQEYLWEYLPKMSKIDSKIVELRLMGHSFEDIKSIIRISDKRMYIAKKRIRSGIEKSISSQ